MVATKRKYGGVSADERRAERRAKLIDAGFAAVEKAGLAGMTVTLVCVSAGLTERYFYENFRNLDELRAALYDRFIDEFRATVLTTMAAAPDGLYWKCRAGGEALFDVLANNSGLSRLYFEVNGSPTLQGRRDSAVLEFSELVELQLRTFGGFDGRPYQRELKLLSVTLVGGIVESFRQWIAGHLDVEPAELIDYSATLCVEAVQALRNKNEGKS
ncbi:TetR/AcrR family transcriptional regulator [Smaragdicoccus niigatensis]|uniref:TetR/AcrR family transcriptional regulator n=1 Tax=Smaragdicoccus niigatensis TaxID=359359 RepID=UPI00036FFAA4|nr:TetR/AcrR family transcriptional regulator [Smaragdicoccus niigatensis]